VLHTSTSLEGLVSSRPPSSRRTSLCVCRLSAVDAPSHCLNSIRASAHTRCLSATWCRDFRRSLHRAFSRMASVLSRPNSSRWTAASALVALRTVNASSHRLNSIRSRCSHPVASRPPGVRDFRRSLHRAFSRMASVLSRPPSSRWTACSASVVFRAVDASSHRLNSIRSRCSHREPPLGCPGVRVARPALAERRSASVALGSRRLESPPELNQVKVLPPDRLSAAWCSRLPKKPPPCAFSRMARC
jgi:hypothetical protein